MRFTAPFSFAYVAAAVGTYSNFQLTSNNPDECSQCQSLAGSAETDLTSCLALVPSSCIYSVSNTIPDTVSPTPCSQSLGASLVPLWPTIPSTVVTAMTGSLDFVFTGATATDCTYNVFTSSDETDECKASGGTPVETPVSGSSINLSGFTDKYYNLVVANNAANCGSVTQSVTASDVTLTLTVMGTSEPEETSGALPLLSLSTALILFGTLPAA